MNNQAPSGINPGVSKQVVLQGSFLAKIPIISALYHLFGGESYTKEELQNYIDHLERTGKIENKFDSDNKARAVVKRQDEFDLGIDIKVLLIREMLKGFTSAADEKSIIRLLREAEPGERTRIVRTTSRSWLWDNFSRYNRIVIEAITFTDRDFLEQSLINRLRKYSRRKLNLYRQNALDPAVRAGIDQVIRIKIGIERTRQRITTPFESFAGIATQFNNQGEVEMRMRRFRVTVRPDIYNANLGNTSMVQRRIIALNVRIRPNYRNNRLHSWRDESVFQLSLQTIYGNIDPTRMWSTYGRGTTQEDIDAGNRSIKFHESRHGFRFLEYISTQPHPHFQGRQGMTRAAVQRAEAQYEAAIRRFIRQATIYSERTVDCAGTPISPQMLRQHGFDPNLCRRR